MNITPMLNGEEAVINSASYCITAMSASWAPATPSDFSISASWASASISASWAPAASSDFSISASWASASISASWAPSVGGGTDILMVQVFF